MKRGLIWIIALVVISILFISLPLVSAQTYSGFNRFVDNIKLFFSSGDNKVMLALEIREKELNSAIYNAKLGNNEEVVKKLESAVNKLKIVQKKVTPDIAEDVKKNIEEVENNLKENIDINSDLSKYFDKYLTEEERTKLFAGLSEKTFNYCAELAAQDYNLMLKDEKCLAYSWMEEKVGKRIEEKRGEDSDKIKEQISICMSNPKDCNCEKVSLSSEKAKCENYKALAVKCEFQGDGSACKKIDAIKEGEESEREKYEKEILEKYLPAECSEAGIRDGGECKKLILTLNQPKTECIENSEYVGDEKCREKLVNEGNVVEECVVDGKLVDSNECLVIVKEGNKPTGKEWELMSGECKEKGIYDSIACDEIVNLPQPCKDAGYYTKKECETLTLKQNLPKECVDANALTPESCERLKLPKKCQGKAYSRDECDVIFIKEKMPPECQESGTYNFHECAKLLYEKVSSISIESEIDYLKSKGINIDEIPDVCLTDKVNFVRSMDCDEALIKEFGIMLPPPVQTSSIPQQCMRGGTPVSPEECEEILQGGIMTNSTPDICKESEVSTPEECSTLLEQQRQEQGIGINMPEECIAISTEECKIIMEEKGIKVEKIEQVQKVEKICKEGEVCEEDIEYEEAILPKECIEIGVSNVKDCYMIAGKINEERIKNGEKIIIDESGKADYINPEQIEKIVDNSEKKSQDIRPDIKEAEKIKDEIDVIEKDIQEIEEKEITNELKEVQEDMKIEGGNREEGSGNGGSENIDFNDNSGGGDGGGETAPVTGEVIGELNFSNLIKKIIDWLF